MGIYGLQLGSSAYFVVLALVLLKIIKNQYLNYAQEPGAAEEMKTYSTFK